MDDALERLDRGAREAFDGTGVVFAYLYGSHATGRARPDSDIDVAVYLADDVPPDDYLSLRLRLPRDLERASGVNGIEIVVLNEAPLRLKGRVLTEGRVFYSRDEPLRVAYHSRTHRLYLDFQIHALPMDRQFLKDVAEGKR